MLTTRNVIGSVSSNRAVLPPITALYPLGKPTKKVLDNGLTIIVDRMPGKLLSNLAIAVSAGAIDDGEIPGLAHFTEHIVCEGSTTDGLQSCEQLRNKLAEVGEDLDAKTGPVFTLYSARVQNEDIFVPLDLYLDIIFSPRVTEDSIDKHREIILRELALKDDGKNGNEKTLGKLYSRLISEMYNNHPILSIEAFGSTLGTKESISSMDRSKVLAFLSRLYTPDNVVVSICGDCNPDEIFRFVEERAGKVRGKRNKIPSPLRFTPKILTDNTVESSKYAMLGLITEGPTQFGNPTHRQATAIVCAGLRERIFREVREKKKIDYSPTAGYSPDHVSGRVSVRIDALEERVEEALGILADEIRKIKREGLSKEEFKKITIAAKLFCLNAFEKASFRANNNALAASIIGKLPELYEELENAFRITSDQVIEQARRLFVANQMGLVAVGKENLPSKDILEKLIREID